MKPVQVMMDESLLERFDGDDQVKEHGRSAVLRRIMAEYLRRRRAAGVAAAYRRAYGGEDVMGREFEGWAGEGEWPAE